MIRNVHDAKTHFSKYLNLAAAGEEIILAKAGKPVAKLVPLNAVDKNKKIKTTKKKKTPKRKLGQFDGWVVPDSAFTPMGENELKEWYDGKVFP